MADGARAGSGLSRVLADARVTFQQPEGWPRLHEDALHGLAGDFVRLVEPHSEADPAALLFQFMAAAGNVIGRGPAFAVEASRHHGNLFAAIVGKSSKARKGTSWQWVERALEPADEAWRGRVVKGLSSGEGLIYAVRDGGDAPEPDEGVEDKRLMVVEAEFASVLKRLSRDGNTLSALMREAWDTGRLQTLTKQAPMRATGAHISVVTHITIEELRPLLSATDAANGFANRFLWVCAARSKHLPEGGALDDSSLSSVSSRLQWVISRTGVARVFRRTERARALWFEVYPRLSSEDATGLFGQVTSRSEAQVVRLSLLFAVLDGADAVDEHHLRAALALWQYAEDSARFIFGEKFADKTTNRVEELLTEAGDEGLTRDQLFKALGGHTKASALGGALEALQRAGRATAQRTPSGGRPSERWFLTNEGRRP